MYYYDGQAYETEADVPDFGSIEFLRSEGPRRQYQAKQADFAKLPKYVHSGSECIMIDSGNVYVFSEKRNAWEPLGG